MGYASDAALEALGNTESELRGKVWVECSLRGMRKAGKYIFSPSQYKIVQTSIIISLFPSTSPPRKPK